MKKLYAAMFCQMVLVLGAYTVYSQKMEQTSVERETFRQSELIKRIAKSEGIDKNKKPPSFRYIIFDVTDNQTSDDDQPTRQKVEVLMEASAFNEENLVWLFRNLSNRFPSPMYLTIDVHTSLLTIETPEERETVSDHTSREDFYSFYKTASYTRFLDGSEVFEYAVGEPPEFERKIVSMSDGKSR